MPLKSHKKFPAPLTIGGFDPTGGAGITRDLLTFFDYGVTGYSIITANTVQDGVTVFKTNAIKSKEVDEQLDALLKKNKVDIVKISMVAKGETLKLIMATLKKHKIKKIILDPITSSSGGTELIDKKGIDLIRLELKSFYLITPNINETQTLIAKNSNLEIKTIFDMKAAATILSEMGANNVLITGGHLKESPTDLLFDGKNFTTIKGSRINTSIKDLHGTGCILTSAITANLFLGKELKESIRKSKTYLEKTIKNR